MKKIIIFTILSFTLLAGYAYASIPIATDSRIKTFVYNENEVFKLTIHYGYISSIEFGKSEQLQVIAPGNDYSWTIRAEGNRIFIKALEGAAHTNMTVITDKHIYQFELESKNPDDGLDEELVYVVRFFYPGESLDRPKPVVDTSRFIPKIEGNSQVYNFDYSIAGPESISPLKVFDDGKSTYFKFSNNNSVIPHIFSYLLDGSEQRTSYSRKGEFIVVDNLANKYTLKLGNDVVYVFNESSGVANNKGNF